MRDRAEFRSNVNCVCRAPRVHAHALAKSEFHLGSTGVLS